MSDKFVSKDPFVLEYCLDRYKTQEMCNKDVDLCLLALKLVPDWLVMKKKKKKMIKKLTDAALSNDDIVFFK